MGDYKYPNVIVRGNVFMSYGDFSLFRGIRERAAERIKSGNEKHDRKDRKQGHNRIDYTTETIE